MAYSLTAHNTFGIAATCDAFLEYTSVEELRTILSQIGEQHWLHIGAGSNLLFVHPHFEGIILHSGIKAGKKSVRLMQLWTFAWEQEKKWTISSL